MPQNAPYAPFRQIPQGSRILLAFSGGVDSAVAAVLALRAGYQVTAVHMTLLPAAKNPGGKPKKPPRSSGSSSSMRTA